MTRAPQPGKWRAHLAGATLLGLAALLLSAASLVLVPAPTSTLWIIAILAGEWGQYGAVVCLLIALLGLHRRSWLGVAAALVAAGALCIFLVPTFRARTIAARLPRLCTVAFGASSTSPSGGRTTPFSIFDSFRGVERAAGVDITEEVYGTNGSKPLKLDVYRSKRRRAPAPLILIIHGGSWNGGNKRQLPAINRYLAAEGYIVAAIDYRHAPKWQFPSAVEDVFHALEFLKGRAGEFGIDPARVVLLGRSAGGQLALSAAYAGRDPAIRGVVAFYAPTDLVVGYDKPSAPGVLDSKKVLREYLGGTPAEKPRVYAAASPVNFVGANTPPTLLIHGLLDPMVWPIHSELLADRLAAEHRPHLYLRLPWATHGCDANLSGPSGQLSLYAIDQFLSTIR